jgi:hypothetical protein
MIFHQKCDAIRFNCLIDSSERFKKITFPENPFSGYKPYVISYLSR